MFWHHRLPRRGPPGGWIVLAGVVLLAAWVSLIRFHSLIGAGVVPFLCSFCVAGAAYVWALRRLDAEVPSMRVIWGFALAFRLALLLTPVSLSEDVYRYIWDGHLLGQRINPYAEPVESTLLDEYDTPLRERVDYAWMASPYLPAAQVYFTVLESLAPQNPFIFQLGAAVMDMATGGMLLLVVRRLRIADKAALIYLWNPLVVFEFSHGAHVDALMLFLVITALWGLLDRRPESLTLSAIALAAAVLVKGWPALAAPLFFPRWGVKRVVLFGACVAVPLALFASGAGWGLSGTADGRGVFGALRIYAATWNFNSGIYTLIEKVTGSEAARLLSMMVPGLSGVCLGWLAWKMDKGKPGGAPVRVNLAAADLRLVRWMALPFGLTLLLAPTIHPWYLTLVLALLPFFWPADGEPGDARHWVWPWVYFMFFEAFTYLAYADVSAPGGLELIRLLGYAPFWLLLILAATAEIRKSAGRLRI